MKQVKQPVTTEEFLVKYRETALKNVKHFQSDIEIDEEFFKEELSFPENKGTVYAIFRECGTYLVYKTTSSYKNRESSQHLLSIAEYEYSQAENGSVRTVYKIDIDKKTMKKSNISDCLRDAKAWFKNA